MCDGLAKHENQRYLVYECKIGEKVNFDILWGDEIFKRITEAKEKGVPLVVFKIGECVIDWSD
jgi:hypothetical protein